MIREVGKPQPKSRRFTCLKCGAELEYLVEDLREDQGLFYLDCPRRGCKQANYLGTEVRR